MSDDQSCEMPKGELALRVYAMPSDTNVYGQIFGGWVLGQMDIGGAIAAGQAAGGLRMECQRHRSVCRLRPTGCE